MDQTFEFVVSRNLISTIHILYGNNVTTICIVLNFGNDTHPYLNSSHTHKAALCTIHNLLHTAQCLGCLGLILLHCLFLNKAQLYSLFWSMTSSKENRWLVTRTMSTNDLLLHQGIVCQLLGDKHQTLVRPRCPNLVPIIIVQSCLLIYWGQLAQ